MHSLTLCFSIGANNFTPKIFYGKIIKSDFVGKKWRNHEVRSL